MGLFDHFPYTNMHELNLNWVLAHLREILTEISSMHDWVEQHKKEYEELKKLYDNIYNGTLTPALENSLRIWVEHNMESIIGNAIKMVFFEITDDGYLVAHIPNSWSEITFATTGLDIEIAGVEYGHLVLQY